ncbi:MAG TPA: lysophospholipid acyltransferase family protein [Chroococcales cyanobacterium]
MKTDELVSGRDKQPEEQTRWMGCLEALFARRVNFREEFYSQYPPDIDEFGFSISTIRQWQPFFQFLYEGYFEVNMVGLENIPKDGRAILIGNHSGVIPMDAFMTFTGLILHHPQPRRVRFLAHHFLRCSPCLRHLICGFGGVPASYTVAKRLLENEELVFFYPEGARGTGKPFRNRYHLCEFDSGFVKAAIETGSPIIPITTVGGDEIYPLLGNLRAVARLLETPYWPITPTFPWLPFFASCIPLPVKFLIEIGKPVYLDYEPEKSCDRQLRKQLAHQFQGTIQAELNRLLKKRQSMFTAWKEF